MNGSGSVDGTGSVDEIGRIWMRLVEYVRDWRGVDEMAVWSQRSENDCSYTDRWMEAMERRPGVWCGGQ